MESPPRLSVITVSWNGREMLRAHLACMDTCRRAMGSALEMILVDNASSDGTPEMGAREFPWVVLIANRENLGFAEGCRQGLERARGRYLLLLNPDCEAGPEALEAMMNFLAAHPMAGAAGCRLLHADGAPQRSAYSDPTAWNYWATHSLLSPAIQGLWKWKRRIMQCLGRDPGAPIAGARNSNDNNPGARGASPAASECDWLMGACIMVPREILEKAGNLDPAYFMYSEDADWCRRIRAAGYKVYYLPGAAILHRQKQSSASAREFTYVRLYRSLLMYSQRFMSAQEQKAMRRSVLTDMAIRRALLPILIRLRPGESASRNQIRLRATLRAAEIWRRQDPAFDLDSPPTAPREHPAPPADQGITQ